MFFRGVTLRYAAVIFLGLLLFLVTGLLVYMLWFTKPQEPPHRSRSVGSGAVEYSDETQVNIN